ncbi:MAG: four helix bundle protein [Desulfocucumaceae bacterium]
MRNFKELKVWQKSHHLALAVYKSTISELEYYLLLSHDVGFLQTSDFEKLTSEVSQVKKMLTSYIKKLKADS